jgi:hypothetical protein
MAYGVFLFSKSIQKVDMEALAEDRKATRGMLMQVVWKIWVIGIYGGRRGYKVSSTACYSALIQHTILLITKMGEDTADVFVPLSKRYSR